MSDKIFDYNIDLYNRNFMNCAQRHYVVMLGRNGLDVDQLFYNTLVSTDLMVEQMYRSKKAKYDFAGPSFSHEDLMRIGVDRQEHFVDTFTEAKPILLEKIAQDGFVLLAGDVYYFPHCPEYRNHHLFHLIVLTGYDEQTNQWQIVDDNPASVMCHYQYDEAMVAAFYDNAVVREFRTFAQQKVPSDQLKATTSQAFIDYLADYQDSYELLERISDFATNEFDAPTVRFGQLHDVFSVLNGSRLCFARYLEQSGHEAHLVQAANDIALVAAKARNQLVQAKILGRIKVEKLIDKCQRIAQQEQQLLTALRQIHLTASQQSVSDTTAITE